MDRGFLAGSVHLKHCKDNYPDVEIDAVPLEGPFVDYLAQHATSIQLVIVGATPSGEVQQLLTSPDALILRNSGFSMLLVRL
jgi:hypothetical protein